MRCQVRPFASSTRASQRYLRSLPENSSPETTTSSTNVTQQAANATAPQANTASTSYASFNQSGSGTTLAGAAVAAGVVAFAASRLLAGGPSLAALEERAVPLEVALTNGKPTVMEFYANWWVALNAMRPRP